MQADKDYGQKQQAWEHWGGENRETSIFIASFLSLSKS